ncbi:MAG: hypothetical protein ACKOE2_01075 [Actinomycetales bacterium]
MRASTAPAPTLAAQVGRLASSPRWPSRAETWSTACCEVATEAAITSACPEPVGSAPIPNWSMPKSCTAAISEAVAM